MANLTASFVFGLTYIGPSNEGATMPAKGVASPYQPQNEGVMDVLDTTPAATVLSVPFGTVAASTGGIIENRTGQHLQMKINGAAFASHSIAPGGVQAWANPTTTTPTPITSIDLITTATQAGLGQVAYRIFGDPT